MNTDDVIVPDEVTAQLADLLDLPATDPRVNSIGYALFRPVVDANRAARDAEQAAPTPASGAGRPTPEQWTAQYMRTTLMGTGSMTLDQIDRHAPALAAGLSAFWRRELDAVTAELAEVRAELERERNGDYSMADHAAVEVAATRLHNVLADVLSRFTQAGHPGVPCHRTGWIRDDTLAQWRSALTDVHSGPSTVVYPEDPHQPKRPGLHAAGPGLTVGELADALAERTEPETTLALVHLPDGACVPLDSAGWDGSCDGVPVFRLFVADPPDAMRRRQARGDRRG